MLRNLNELVPAGPAFGGCRIAGPNTWGRLGSEILAETSSGFSGPGVMANDGLDPSRRYRIVIESLGTFQQGALFVDDFGRLVATSPGQTTYQLYENNILIPALPQFRTITVTLGAVASGIVPTLVVDRWADIIVVPPGA